MLTEREHTEERRATPVQRVLGLALVVLGVSTAAVVWAPNGTAQLRAAPWWVAIVVAAGFTLAERAVFHIEHRREALTVSLSEVPTFFALVFLDLRVAVVVRLVAGFVPIWWERRPPFHKLLFNASLFVFETAGAGLLLRFAFQSTSGSVTWLVATGVMAICLATIAGSVLVSAAIAQFEGGFLAKVANELSSVAWVFVLNASIAGLMLSPALLAPWLIPLALVPLAVFWLFVRKQADVAQQLRDVQALHGFSGTIGAAKGLDDLGAAAASETAHLLRAGRCTLFVLRGGVLEPIGCVGSPIDLPDATVADATALCHDGAATLHGNTGLAPLVTDEGVVGLVAVGDREGAAGQFAAADLARLRTLADQLAAPVARALMHLQLEHEARYDQLTGLANRSTFERSLSALSRADDRTVFVVMFDLDRFKEVNDTLGHHAGDELLIEVAHRLRAAIDPGDLVARFAGDEFAIAGLRHTIDEIDDVVRACTAGIGQAFTINELEIVVNASAGIATYAAPDRSTPSAATLLRRADIAMYHAKQHHLGHEHYRAEIDRRTPARLSMLADLRSAIHHGEIDLHFQPKLDLVTNTVTGAEVLARWTHPSRGPIPPEDFIAVAEQSGLISLLTDSVLERTVTALDALRRAGHDLSLAVNLSAHDLLDELLCDRIDHRLERHGVSPDKLILEITEGTLVYDSSRTRANLARLHDAGIRLSIDDFGTGYSSLRYLRQLPVTELKIDRSFITNLVVEAHDETIVGSTIDLGHSLGLQVVAEGVETNAVAERLLALGCDVAQGYGICRPVSFEHLLSWLSATATSHQRAWTDIR
jgi:diguanylate cyclase (GGDEF)-like protein